MRATPRTAGLAATVLTLGLLGTVPAVPAAAAVITATVTVPASSASGVSSTVTVHTGDTVTITASGSAGYGAEGAAPCVGYPVTAPDGSRTLGGTNCGPKDDPNATLSGAAIGLLIGRIGTGAWFGVGSSDTFTPDATGTLTLAYNDSIYTDNTGSYSATVKDTILGGGGPPPHCPPGGCPP